MAKNTKLQLTIEVDKKTGAIKVAQGEVAGLADATEKAGRSAESGARGFSTLANSLGPLVAAGSVLKFFKDATDAAIVQQDAVSKLNAALANQGALTQEASADLQKYAAALQETTRFGDETILSAQSMLVSFGLTGDKLKETTSAVLDMSTALGVDLKSAAILLGKAFAGETSSLSRYGIIIDENIPKSEKFAAVLQKLKTNFGGAAAADAKTFGGAIQQLKNEFGDLTEKVGFQLIPTLSKIGLTIRDTLPFILKFASVMTGVVSSVIESFNFIGKEIGRIVSVAVDGITTGGVVIKEVLSGNFNQAGILANEMRGRVSKNLSGLVDDAQTTSDSLKEIGQNTWDALIGKSDEALKAQEEQLAQSLAVRAAKQQEAAQAEIEAAQAASERKAQVLADIQAFENEALLTQQELQFQKFENDVNARAEALRKATNDKIQQKIIEDSRIQIIENKRKLLQKKAEDKELDKKKKIEKESFAASVDTANALVSLTKGKNKELNAIAKQASIANALRSTFEGANKALAQGGFFGAAMAAAVIVQGLANVQRIQGFEKGGITPGGTVLLGEKGPELADLPAGTRITPADKTRDILNQGGGTAVVNLTINNEITVIASEDVGGEVVESIRRGIDEFNPALEDFGKSMRDLIVRQGARSS